MEPLLYGSNGLILKKTEQSAMQSKKRHMIPMYIVDYIFDGSELDDEEM